MPFGFHGWQGPTDGWLIRVADDFVKNSPVLQRWLAMNAAGQAAASESARPSGGLSACRIIKR